MNNKDKSRKFVGKFGEDIACEFLMKQGFEIRDRNYLRKYGEIDIVAIKRGMYHFVEVKSVSCESVENVFHETDTDFSSGAYRPEDNVHPWKLMRLSRVIQSYIAEHEIHGREWKFHVITIYLDMSHGKVGIDFIEDIVL
jgi:putative endonuclease